jgi:VWFA-related protein
VYSAETIVDITVTDAKGNPVHGLQRSDFTVEEDHVPRAIRSFHEFSSTRIPQEQLPRLPPNTYSNRQTPSASGALNILLLDTLNTSAAGKERDAFALQTRVKQAAEQYLKSAPAGTRFAVLQLSLDLRILQDFTSDSDLLSRVVHAMPIDLRPTQGGSEGANAAIVDEHGKTVSTDTEMQSVQADEQCRSTLEALKQIAASVASIRGKKNLIWITTGVAGIDDPTVNTIVYDGKLPDYLPDYHKTLALLKAAQVAVYPISASGVVAPIGGVVSKGTSLADGYDLHAAQNLSLDSLAEATGGVAYYNSNDLAGALAKAVQAGADYYTLTYNPPDTKFDGRRHTITVYTDLPNVHLTYRDSYYAEDPRKISPVPALAFIAAAPESSPSAEAGRPADAGNSARKRMGAAFNTAMVRSMPTSTQLLLDVHVEPGAENPSASGPAVLGKLNRRFQGKPLTRYAIRSSVDTNQISLVSGEDLVYHGALEFSLVAYDADGKQVTALSQTVNMRLDDYGYKQLLDAPLSLLQQLDLPAGQQLFVRVGVLDRASGKIGTLEFSLSVPKAIPTPISNSRDLPATQPAQPTQPSTQPSEPTPTLQRRPPTQ